MKRAKEENGIWQDSRKKKKTSWWVAINSPAKEFPPLKALYISLCKPYQDLRMSWIALQECCALCVCSAVPLIKAKHIIPIH